jgi:putative membrane protein
LRRCPEIKLGESAEKKAEHKDVRALARKMVEEHTRQRTALLKLAGSMKLAVVEAIKKDDRAELTRLSRLSGAAYDKEYVTFMITSHEKSLKLYQDWAKQSISIKQRELAEKEIPVIKGHLKLAREILGKLKSS